MDIYEKNGTTEAEFVEIVSGICRQIAKEFVFGSYQYRDICQEAHIEALKALHKEDGVRYDPSRPLGDFLFVHIRNRLKNLRRNKLNKQKIPCKKCPLYDPKCKASNSQCLSFENRNDCEKYEKWYISNKKKMDLGSAGGLPPRDTDEPPVGEDDRGELLSLIDRELGAELRSDFLRMLGGVPISRKRRQDVRAAVKSIIVDSGEYPELDYYWGLIDEL